MLRYCHRTTCNFGAGIQGDIIWHFIDDPAAPFITKFLTMNKFGSASWLERGYDDGSAIGEVIGAKRRKTDGTLVVLP